MERKKQFWFKFGIVIVVVLMIAGVFWYKKNSQINKKANSTQNEYNDALKLKEENLNLQNQSKEKQKAQAENTENKNKEKQIEKTKEVQTALQEENKQAENNALNSVSTQTVVATEPKTEQVKEEKKALPRLLDFGSATCGPCIQQAPILEELKKEYAGKVNIEVLDVYENGFMASAYKIRLIPTQIFFDADGNEILRHEGFMPKEEIVAIFRQLGVQ